MKVPGVAMTDEEVVALAEYLDIVSQHLPPRKLLRDRVARGNTTRAVGKVLMEGALLRNKGRVYEG